MFSFHKKLIFGFMCAACLALSTGSNLYGMQFLKELLIDFNFIPINNIDVEPSLKYAIDYDDVDMVEELLSHDNVLLYEDIEGFSPLIYALLCGSVNVAKLLVDQFCVDVNQEDDEGFTPLIAAIEGFIRWNMDVQKIIPVLIKSGARINQCNRVGQTPLLYALAHADPTDEKAVQLINNLLKIRCIDVTISFSDVSPIMLAEKRGWVKIQRRLIEKEQIMQGRNSGKSEHGHRTKKSRRKKRK